MPHSPGPSPDRKGQPRKRHSPKSTGRGLSRSTPSPSPATPPNPLKVASMLADAVEMSPSLAIPLEVRTGGRLVTEYTLPKHPIALLDLYNPEDGRTYQALVYLPR